MNYREADRERHAHAAAMAAKHPKLPSDVHDSIYRLAWQEGHSSGYHDVEIYYAEIAEIAEEAYEAGRYAQ